MAVQCSTSGTSIRKLLKVTENNCQKTQPNWY